MLASTPCRYTVARSTRRGARAGVTLPRPASTGSTSVTVTTAPGAPVSTVAWRRWPGVEHRRLRAGRRRAGGDRFACCEADLEVRGRRQLLLQRRPRRRQLAVRAEAAEVGDRQVGRVVRLGRRVRRERLRGIVRDLRRREDRSPDRQLARLPRRTRRRGGAARSCTIIIRKTTTNAARDTACWRGAAAGRRPSRSPAPAG